MIYSIAICSEELHALAN
uniref:Uncharacterized protein n=1 Tax=Rhizophora mucronata TaxID=61149 RepID=A0A2P2N184_RHIMU